MNICLFSNIHVSELRGGVERVTYTLSQSFKKNGHNIIMVSALGPINNDQLLERQYVLPDPTTYTQININYLKTLFEEHNIEIIINQSETQASQDLLNIFHKKCILITCIHTHPLAPLKGIQDSWDLWKKQNSKLLYAIKLPYYILRYYFQKYNRSKFLKKKYNALYKRCNAIILLSESYKEHFCKITGIKDKGKLYAIGNPNTFDKNINIEIDKKENLILFVSRLIYSPKRCDRVLHIWKRIEDKVPDWKLIILGDGPDKEIFYKIKTKLNLERVTFTGTVNPQPYYQTAKISWITSTHEGYPLVAIESLQHNVIPIAFGSFETIYDIIDNNKTGFIIKPFNEKAFSQTVLELIKDPVRLNKIQCNIANREDKFNINTIITQWETLLTKLQTKK